MIRNLYWNGKSEYTDAEAVANLFVSEVLNSGREQWDRKWEEFAQKLFDEEIFKDNKTIFRLGVDVFTALFRALWISFSKEDMMLEKKEDILDKALDFYRTHNKLTDELDLEKIVIFNFCEIGSRKIFFKVLGYFNDLKITGNMNREKVYYSFLKNYFVFAYREGYLRNLDIYEMDFLSNSEERSIKLISECRNECEKQMNFLIETGICQNPIREELELFQTFCSKNIEMMEKPERAKQKRMIMQSKISSRKIYTNEEIYHELENDIETSKADPDGYKKKLICRYKENSINLREYMELWNNFAEK